MGLTRRSESNTIYLQAKFFCLWQELKKQVDGCDVVTTNNPSTGQPVTKYGHVFNNVTGTVKKLETYRREHQGKQYYGFKLKLVDGSEVFVLDMPYVNKQPGQMLKRFLRVAPAIDWSTPLSIDVFKGKGKDGKEETGIWFRQAGQTIKPYFTREDPGGMPAAVQDEFTKEWDFKAQDRWLAERLIANTIVAIDIAVSHIAPPLEPHEQHAEPEPEPEEGAPFGEITDDDVPF